MLRIFGFSIFLTIAAVIVAAVSGGAAAAFTISVLICIEVAFSFDNAVINAKVLVRLSEFWQKLFLTVGLLIAVVGMRFVFPIVIVMVTADLGASQVIDLALNNPDEYGKELDKAHYSIAAFGGAFLMTLTLYFFLEKRKDLWIVRLERPLQRYGGNVWSPAVLVAILMLVLGYFAGSHREEVLQAGLLGVVIYTAMKLGLDALGKVTGTTGNSKTKYVGFGAFLAFLYLEVLDASFSFDGVLGAFAITNQVLLIALGLGVGAIWVRSLTIWMVRHGTLDTYKYLEHGAHYAILILATALLSSVYLEIPEAIAGITGIGVIIASFIASREAIKEKSQKTTA